MTRSAVITLALLLASTAGAQDAPAGGTTSQTDASARRVYLEGRTAFDEGRFDDALRLFEAAYELSPRPELLYNIGTAADRLRLNERALEAFEEYIIALPFSDNREAVEARIRVIRSELERERQLQQSLQQAREEPEAEPPSKSRWWIGVLVGGLVLAATAVTLGVLLRDDEPQYMTGDAGRLFFTLERTR